jgi:hypothetical protein
MSTTVLKAHSTRGANRNATPASWDDCCWFCCSEVAQQTSACGWDTGPLWLVEWLSAVSWSGHCPSTQQSWRPCAPDSQPAQGAMPAPQRVNTKHAVTSRPSMEISGYLSFSRSLGGTTARARQCQAMQPWRAIGTYAIAGLYWGQHSMNRLLAIIALVTLTSAPVSRVLCGWTCTHRVDVSAVESCHGENGPEWAFRVGADHCDDDSALPIARAAKLTDGTDSPAPGLVAVQPAFATGLLSSPATRSAGAARPAPANRLIPLRI